MPEPKPPEEEEQYGPPEAPKATRTWRMPQGEDRADRGAKNLFEYVMGPGYNLRSMALDGPQLAHDLADPDVREMFQRTGQWHGAYGRMDGGQAKLVADVVDDESWYDAKAHPEFHDGGYNPLERFADWTARKLYQRNMKREVAAELPRQGRTEVLHGEDRKRNMPAVEAPPAAQQESFIDWNGSVGVTR